MSRPTLNQNPPAKPWVIKTLKDHGPGHWYRYSITLENHYLEPPSPMSWTVRDLNDERFDTTQIDHGTKGEG